MANALIALQRLAFGGGQKVLRSSGGMTAAVMHPPAPVSAATKASSAAASAAPGKALAVVPPAGPHAYQITQTMKKTGKLRILRREAKGPTKPSIPLKQRSKTAVNKAKKVLAPHGVKRALGETLTGHGAALAINAFAPGLGTAAHVATNFALGGTAGAAWGKGGVKDRLMSAARGVAWGAPGAVLFMARHAFAGEAPKSPPPQARGRRQD